MAKKIDPTQGMACVPVKGLRPGGVLKSPIFDKASPLLLIAAGLTLTKDQIDKLIERGITEVRVGLADLAELSGERPRAAAGNSGKRIQAAPEAAVPTNSFGSATPFLSIPQRDHTQKGRERLNSVFSSRFENSIVEVRNIFEGVADGTPDGAMQVVRSIETALADMAEDFDVFLGVGLKPDPERYPFSHSLQVSRLALSIGAMLGIDKSKLVELGVGCMLHDVGMLKLDPELPNRERPLDYLERLDITKHPANTFDLIQKLVGLSPGSRMVAYQMHERLDGSGYPRRRVGSQIHPLAKIAMVADSFIAMTSPRPHRPAIPPYYAMVELLEATKQGKFDSEAVRGLLEAVSLFPLGSFVELNDGRKGKVIGANREDYRRPIVEVLAVDRDDPAEVVNLLTNNAVEIVRPMLNPNLRSEWSESQAVRKSPPNTASAKA